MRTAGSDQAGGFMLTEYSSASSEPTPEVPRGAVPDQKTSRAPQSPARVLDAFGSDPRALCGGVSRTKVNRAALAPWPTNLASPT